MVQQHSSCLSTICSSHSSQQQAEALCDEPVGRTADSFIQFGPREQMHAASTLNRTSKRAERGCCVGYLTKLWTCCLASGCSWRQAWRTLPRIRLMLKNCTSGARSPCSRCKHSQACSEDAYSVNHTFAAWRWPESGPYKACIALCAAALLLMLSTVARKDSIHLNVHSDLVQRVHAYLAGPP